MKPIVFNYKDYERLKSDQEAAQAEIDRLRDKVANLEIRCRILEAKLEEADHER